MNVELVYTLYSYFMIKHIELELKMCLFFTPSDTNIHSSVLVILAHTHREFKFLVSAYINEYP